MSFIGTKPLDYALSLYLDQSIPSFGTAEAPIDPPTWIVSDQPSDPSLPGGGLGRHSMLYIGEDCNKMYLVHNGKVIWTYCAGQGWEYDDVWMLTNGNILFSHMYWVGEITPRKDFVWRMDAPAGTEIHTLQPIGLDRVLMIANAAPQPRLMIVNKKTGLIELDREIPYDPACGVHGQFRRFRLTAEGTFLAPQLSAHQVVEYDRHFEPIWSYQISSPWAAIRLKNGNTLITSEQDELLREVTPNGETAWEFQLSQLPAQWRIAGSQSCVRLDNGNTILCSRGGGGTTPQLVEITPEKEVVWVLKDWKNLGPATAVQILTESGIPEKPGDCQR